MSQTQQVPVFANVSTMPTFDAFKVEDRFSFVRRYSPTVQAIENFRHAVIRYRNTDKNVAEKVANMATIPQLKLPEEYSLIDERAQKVILGVFEDEQDNMIRSMIDAGKTTISWDEILLPKVLDSLTAIRVSNRLTKEQIEGWARIALADFCNTRADQISNEKSYNDEQKQKQRAGTLNAYVELACKLAAPVPNIGQGNAIALKNCFAVAKLADDMTKVLQAKLEAILNPVVTQNGNL